MEAPKTSLWLRASLLLATVPLGILLLSAIWIITHGEEGIVNVAPEQIGFFAAVYLSVPLGLLCLISIQRSYASGEAGRLALGFGILMGASNLLIGSAAWIGTFMMMGFVSHH